MPKTCLEKSAFSFSLRKTVSGKSPNSSSISPDTSSILCCEVCGKYGLPHEFSASGRFCSLSCVGVYTGRRNKGREYVRHAKTVDGKIVKRKKKDKSKNQALSPHDGDLQNVSISRPCMRRSLDYIVSLLKKYRKPTTV